MAFQKFMKFDPHNVKMAFFLTFKNRQEAGSFAPKSPWPPALRPFIPICDTRKLHQLAQNAAQMRYFETKTFKCKFKPPALTKS